MEKVKLFVLVNAGGFMGKVEGISIKNYGSLKNVTLGKTFSHQTNKPLSNMTTIIGPSGNGKSTIADVFGFIADCLDMDVEAACDANNRGGFEQIRSQGVNEPIGIELYYRESSNTRPITYEVLIDLDKSGRPYVKEERLRQRVETRGWPKSFLHLQNGVGFAFEGNTGGQDDETGASDGTKVPVELSDNRKLGVVTLGAMKQYSRIEKFLKLLEAYISSKICSPNSIQSSNKFKIARPASVIAPDTPPEKSAIIFRRSNSVLNRWFPAASGVIIKTVFLSQIARAVISAVAAASSDSRAASIK